MRWNLQAVIGRTQKIFGRKMILGKANSFCLLLRSIQMHCFLLDAIMLALRRWSTTVEMRPIQYRRGSQNQPSISCNILQSLSPSTCKLFLYLFKSPCFNKHLAMNKFLRFMIILPRLVFKIRSVTRVFFFKFPTDLHTILKRAW